MRARIEMTGPPLPPASVSDPRDISGLALWLRADLGIHTATGVSQWDDQSGSGDANKNFAQATGSKQPTLNAADAAFNGQPTISFLGSASQELRTPGAFAVAFGQPVSMFVVGSDDGLADHYWLEDWSTLQLETDPSGHYLYAGATLVASDTTATKQVFGGVASGASSKIYVNALTPVRVGNAGASFGVTGPMVLGSNFAAPYLTGKIAEVAIFSKELSGAELSELFEYFALRYAITIGG